MGPESKIWQATSALSASTTTLRDSLVVSRTYQEYMYVNLLNYKEPAAQKEDMRQES